MSDWGSVTVTVEAAFGHQVFAVSPVWTNISSYVYGFDMGVGRNRLADRFENASGTFLLDNGDGRFDPGNTSSPYSPHVTLGVPVRVTVTYSATTYTLFRGVVTGWPLEYERSGSDSWVQLPVAGLGLTLSRDVVDVVLAAAATGVRVVDVLDEVGYPAGLRDLDDGVASMPAFTGERSPLTLLEDAATVEAGQFLVGLDGVARFADRVARSAAVTSPSATFGPGVGELEFESLVVSFDDDELVNAVTATVSTTSEHVTVSDGGSTLGWGQSMTVDAPFENVNDAKNVAEWLLDTRKDLRVRVRSMTVAPLGDGDLWVQVLARKVGDAVRVKHTPPGGGTALNQVCVIERVRHTVTAAGKWETQWALSTLSAFEEQSFWTVGTSQLGTGTRLA